LRPLLKKKQELAGTRFINKACILYKRLLGSRLSFVQMKSVKTHFSLHWAWMISKG
jgi:hypothetical protein